MSKFKNKCIYSYYSTLLDLWVEWNAKLLMGEFPASAGTLNEALGESSSDCRSRAKEMFRIGLLSTELTKGDVALRQIREGKNVQSNLGFIAAVIHKASNEYGKERFMKAESALCAIFSVIQSVSWDHFETSINSIAHRLLEVFPCPEDINLTIWLRYLLSGTFCPIASTKNTKIISDFTDFFEHRTNSIELSIIDEGSNKTICTMRSVADVRKAIENGVSLNKIVQQKMALFILGTDRDVTPKGFLSMAYLNYPDFLKYSYEVERDFVTKKPYLPLYNEDIGQSGKSHVLEELEKISELNNNLKNEYNKLMKDIYQGAKDALSLLKQSSDSLNESSLQKIYYGAPGTGKSREIKELTKDDDTVIRTTFHPDSDYSTFVGCYKPTMGDPKPIYGFDANGNTVEAKVSTGAVVKERKIEYKFVQQAFTKAYIRAWKKMGDTSLWTKKVTATPPTGETATPYKMTGKKGVIKVFARPEDDVTLLNDAEKDALLEVDNFDFPFDGINNFGELHDNIKVVVTDEPTEEQIGHYRKKITLKAAQIRDLYSKYKKTQKYYFLESILAKILKKLGWSWHPDLDKLKDYTGNDITIEVEDSYSLLGLYNPITKTVYLFKKNIRDNIKLLCAVYIHEMFHAYYDNSNNSDNKYVPEIEEPIVECNTLCFLELFDKAYMDSYITSVERKQQSDAINYYGFGTHLFENRSLDWMRLYQNANNIDKSSTIVYDYKDKFSPIYPFGNEEETRSLLYMILKGIKATSPSGFSKADQFLIIEEINRGNCAQIFGDLFQLLDRKDGYSEYPIEADEDLRKELENEFVGLKLDAAVEKKINSIFEENYPDGITDKILNGELLVLPENLYIWATMNTSDQSLFPIDSAFKRRWDWKYIPIDTKKESWVINVDGTDYDWSDFLEEINAMIESATSSEDKMLGFYFCKAEDNVISAERFVSKVLFYLWNDVFKDYGFDDPIFNDEDDKKLTFRNFYKADGTIDENKVKKFLDNLQVKCENEESYVVDEEKYSDPKTPKKRLSFWQGFNHARAAHTEYCKIYSKERTASKEHFMDLSFGVSAYHPYLSVLFSKKTICVGLSIYGTDRNSEIFKQFKEKESDINDIAGVSLIFEKSKNPKNPDNPSYSIVAKKEIDITDESTWEEAYNWMMDMAIKINTIKETYKFGIE